MSTFNIPKKIYFKNGSTGVALRELTEIYHLKRALLVTDSRLYHAGVASFVGSLLRKQGMRTAEFFSFSSVPTVAEIQSGLPKMLEFEPDVIVGIGGGGAMSAAKAMWVLYENPEMDLTKAAKKPELIHTNVKAELVLVATSFGSGAQNSPFAVLENKNGKQVVLQSMELLPLISVTDAMFTATLSAEQVKAGGLAMLAMATQAYCDENCNEYEQGLLREAIKAVLTELKSAEEGNPEAREKLQNAGALAGAAYGNVVKEFNSEAAFYSTTDLDKNGKQRLKALAKELGYDGVKELKTACEKLK